MFIERAKREELKKLSKEVFGSSSRWQKILNEGYSEILTRIVSEEIPGENGAASTFVETKVPVLTESGGKQSRMKYHTVESIEALMLDFKAKRDAMIAEYNRKQEVAKAEKAQKDLEEKIHSELSGSAI